MKFLTKIAEDKKLHLAAGACAGILGAMWSIGLFGWHGWPVFAAGVALAALAGAAKEAYDALFPVGHTVDVMDFVYTAAGGVLPAALIAWGAA